MTAPAIVTRPGLYLGIDENLYHADTNLAPELGRSLSSSGAKTILDCPARYQWQREHKPFKNVWDLGTIAHRLILRSDDNRIRVADTYEWKPWQTWNPWKDTQRAAGLIPTHRGDLLAASRMASAVRRHPVASRIFSEGTPEVSMYWIDETTGVTCRGRLDWIRDNAIVDLKTIASADAHTIRRQSLNFGYAQQADFYRRGVHATTGEWLPFVHVFVESDAPHFVHVVQLDDDFLALGSAKNDEALALYAQCESNNDWPAYNPNDITLIHPPAWAS